ncbi:malonyl-ACP O-methyltransferase BioC [Bacteroides fragilis]|uniref:malonyl-ACP O-methyltransferase BioC n=1 Tax=Bacteroides fragilis TaxID=817 RepID=UPI0022AA934A|nr:malonyl-ACP O-methyltransferase BioC [Bacteroides fragilis]MCZ2661847.1 malonyl-ACP O-methyltransferase BioC [Bacteroides fragilis]
MILKRLYQSKYSQNSPLPGRETGSEVILFFTGWGMDETPFIHYLPQHRDLIICYDYRSLDFDKTLLSTYTQIQVVAWSMGVWAASQVLQGSNLPITQSIAINGTPFPIDDARGIPPVIFEGTLNNLSEATLQKFRRRMCGSGSDFKAFCEIAPQRTVEELKEELTAIHRQYNELPPSAFVWNKAIIGESDHIFPSRNQEQAWEGHCTEIQRYEGAHYDDKILKENLSPIIPFSKQLIAQRFSKAIDTYPHEARVQQQIARKMCTLLQQHLPRQSFRRIVEFGCGTGTYSRLLLRSFRPERLLLNDLCEEMRHSCEDILNEQVSFLPGDAEALAFPHGTELITSCSVLQWFEHPDAFFRKCENILNAQGYIAFSTFGKENMKEICQLTGQGLAYRSREELTASLSALYDIVHTEEEVISLNFSNPMEVLYHLKQTGVTGTCNRAWTRSKLSLFCQEYERLFSPGKGSVSLTYHPIYIIAKKR